MCDAPMKMSVVYGCTKMSVRTPSLHCCLQDWRGSSEAHALLVCLQARW